MAREIRIEDAGFHHIINRGVNKADIFQALADKDKFLEIVCEVSEHYGFRIHAYVLMNNHYHLLLENTRENLSAGMRQINATLHNTTIKNINEQVISGKIVSNHGIYLMRIISLCFLNIWNTILLKRI